MVNVQGIYVALFGRPADPVGLAHYEAAAEKCGDLSWLDSLVASSEYGLRLQGISLEGAVNAIYQNLFDRDADPQGLAYFVDGLNSGRFTSSTLAVAIPESAVGADKAALEAKIAAADLFTVHLDTATEILAYVGPAAAEIGRTFVDGVTASALATENDVDNVIMSLVRTGGQFEAGEVREQPLLTVTTLAPIEEGGSRLITQADLLAGASDPQGLSLMALDLQLVGKGSLVSNGDGTWTFTAAPGDESNVRLTYSVTNSWSLPVATSALLDITPDDAIAPLPSAYASPHRIEAWVYTPTADADVGYIGIGPEVYGYF